MPSLRRSRLRRILEFAIKVALCVVLLRTFAIRSYSVVSSSMAPALSGPNVEFHCPATGLPILMAATSAPHPQQKGFCPQCGSALTAGETKLRGGDQLLVNRAAYAWRGPARFEPVVIERLDDQNRWTTMVKRVVGLPGENVQIQAGDLWINGERVAKELRRAKGMAVPIVDFGHVAMAFANNPRNDDLNRLGRWQGLGSWDDDRGAFELDGGSLAFTPAESAIEAMITAGAFADDIPRRNDGAKPLRDFLVSCYVECRPNSTAASAKLSLSLNNGRDRARLEFDFNSREFVLAHNGDKVAGGDLSNMIASIKSGALIDLAIVDGWLLAAVDGDVIREWEIPPKENAGGSSNEESVAASEDRVSSEDHGDAENDNLLHIKATGLRCEISQLVLSRDVHYTNPPGLGPRHGLDADFELGADEYFVLGDNSRQSHDSRFWRKPAVRRAEIVGRPILVHWPAAKSRYFDGWIQVPRFDKIRYIR